MRYATRNRKDAEHIEGKLAPARLIPLKFARVFQPPLFYDLYEVLGGEEAKKPAGPLKGVGSATTTAQLTPLLGRTWRISRKCQKGAHENLRKIHHKNPHARRTKPPI